MICLVLPGLLILYLAAWLASSDPIDPLPLAPLLSPSSLSLPHVVLTQTPNQNLAHLSSARLIGCWLLCAINSFKLRIKHHLVYISTSWSLGATRPVFSTIILFCIAILIYFLALPDEQCLLFPKQPKSMCKMLFSALKSHDELIFTFMLTSPL